MALRPDAVVVANGGRVVVPAIPGSEQPLVHSGPAAVRAASLGRLPEGRRVAIVGADLVALELAEFLAARGRLVSVLESGETIAPEVGNKRKTEHMDRLDRLGVAVHVRAQIERIVPDGVMFIPSGGSSRHLPAHSVVITGTLEANTEVYEKLVAALPDISVRAAGDCTGLGLIRKATEDGARAGCAI